MKLFYSVRNKDDRVRRALQVLWIPLAVIIAVVVCRFLLAFLGVLQQLFHFDVIAETIPKLIPYFFKVTLTCVLITVVVGSIFGFLFAACKLSKNRVLRGVVYAYTEIIRGTPFLVLLYLLYFALPMLVSGFGIDLNSIDKLYYLLLTLIIFASCRLSEIMRSAYESINKGQMEAAVSVGLTAFQGMFHIVLPQAFFIALPNIGNLLVGMVLETALGFTIGVYDIMGQAKLINARSYGAYNMEVYLAAALIYWVVSMLIAKGTTV